VHGDLRETNIFIHTENLDCQILDFDWAERDTQGLYPFFMNHQDILWPPEAADGKPLQYQHDLWWLDKIFEVVGITTKLNKLTI